MPLRLLLLCFLLLAAPALADFGGQMVQVDGGIDYHRLGDMVIGADGAMYAGSTESGVYRIVRSQDGGFSWELWGELSESDPDASLYGARMAMGLGSPEQIVVAWVSTRPGVSEAKCSVADTSGNSPVWSTTVFYATVSSLTVDVSTSELPVGPATIFAVCKAGSELRFTRSLDGGSTFSPTINLTDNRYLAVDKFDIAGDRGNVVQVAFTTRQIGPEFWVDETRIYHTSGIQNGTDRADWFPEYNVKTYDGDCDISLATSQNTDDVVLAVNRDPSEHDHSVLFSSWDAGRQWTQASVSLAPLSIVTAAWGDDGFALAGNAYDDIVNMAKPEGPLDGAWLIEPFLEADPHYRDIAFASHPNGEFAAMVQSHHGDTGQRKWFDAEWFADPGYGVPEWPERLECAPGGNHSMTSSPALSDLDGDGDYELLYTTSYPDGPLDTLHAYDLETNTRVELGSPGSLGKNSAPATIDMFGDGVKDIFVGNETGQVAGYEPNGTALGNWPVDLGTGSPAFVSCGQVTGLAPGEVVAASGSQVWVLRADGTPASEFPYAPPSYAGDVVGRVAIGDVTGDGSTELVAVFEFAVALLDRAGNLLEVLDQGPQGPSAGASLVDFDDDGDLEIVVPKVDGTVLLMHHDGSSYGPAWPWDTGTGSPVSAVAIADVFFDDQRDLIFTTLNGDMFLRTANGVTPGGWVESLGTPDDQPNEPIVAALAPGAANVAAGGPGGYGYVWNEDGLTEGWRRDMRGPIEHSMAAGDVDDDGLTELVVPAGNYFYVLDMGVAAAGPQKRWLMSGARASRSGCADCGPRQVTAVEERTPTSVALLRQNAPNPFNPRTTISFAVTGTRSSAVHLAVYDVRGRLVRELASDTRDPGEFSVVWDGRDNHGRDVVSGVYSYRLSVGGQVQTRKMTLVR